MKTLDEKKLLARMARNIGQPDLDLEAAIFREEELTSKLFTPPKSSVIVEDKLFTAPGPTTNVPLPSLVDAAAEAITNTQSDKKLPTLAEKMRDADMDGIRSAIRDLNAKMGTLSWGGGGTGVVRISETDDFNKFSIVQGGTMTYENGVFHIREAGNIDSLNGTVTGTFSGNVVISSVEDHGIKVDVNAPTYGWRDIIGAVQPKSSGAGSPTRAFYRGNIGDYSFVLNDQVDFVFHIPHDYVPGSDIFFHVHWSHNGTSISGDAEFTIYHMYSKGHDQENFSPERTLVITHPNTDIAGSPQYRHFIDESAISGAVANTVVFASNDIEVDGLLICTLKLTGKPTIGAGTLFIHTCDIHYQSTNMATKNKSPNFWTT